MVIKFNLCKKNLLLIVLILVSGALGFSQEVQNAQSSPKSQSSPAVQQVENSSIVQTEKKSQTSPASREVGEVSSSSKSQDFTQKISWQKEENALEYKVEIVGITDLNFNQTFTTQENYIEFSYKAGTYSYKVTAFDFLVLISV